MAYASDHGFSIEGQPPSTEPRSEPPVQTDYQLFSMIENPREGRWSPVLWGEFPTLDEAKREASKNLKSGRWVIREARVVATGKAIHAAKERA